MVPRLPRVRHQLHRNNPEDINGVDRVLMPETILEFTPQGLDGSKNWLVGLEESGPQD